MYEVMQGISGNEDVVIGRDIYGHVGRERKKYERIHGGFGFREGNEVGERVLDFALSYDFAVINTYFRKKK